MAEQQATPPPDTRCPPAEQWPPRNANRRWLWAVLLLGMLLPAAITTLHLVVLAGAGRANAARQAAYIGGTVLQFALPLVGWVCYEGGRLKVARPTLRGVEFGLQFGFAVTAGMLALYFGLLRDTPAFARTAQQLAEKLDEFGIASPLGFALFAAFLTVIHSFLEEYYWRWFIFGWLRRLMAVWPAVLLSSLAFALHHVVLLAVWFPADPVLAVLPLSLCVATGGAVWAWLYQQTGSLYAPWLSHMLVDGAVFVIGYDLYFRGV